MIQKEKESAKRNRQRWLPNLTLLVVSILIPLVMAEFISRQLFPVNFFSRFIDLETGQETQLYRAKDMLLTPNLNLRHTSLEFDVKLRLTPLGARGPASGLPPAVIFIGDSFTFGWGLGDGQTFVDRFCEKARLKCANLGMPGTGTRIQLDILERYLMTEGWRPTVVYLVFWGMTSHLTAGNDLGDNLKAATQAAAQSSDMIEASQKGSKNSTPDMQGETETSLITPDNILELRRYLLKSNLFRIIYLKAAPLFRAKFSLRPSPGRLQRALDATRIEFHRFGSLSEKFGFSPRVVLIHPMHDLINGTWKETEKAIQEILPNLSLIKTAESFLPNPVKYYFIQDGHFNSEGASLVGSILIQNRQ